MITKATFEFLAKLSKNNNREWFHKHKPEYNSIKANFIDLAEELGQEISRFDKKIAATIDNKNTVKVFRIYKDVRFSKDKTPYKTNLGVTIVPNGMKSGHAGYYMHIAPNDSFLGGGMHMPEPKNLNKIRESIAEDSSKLRSIIKSKTFNKFFDGINAHEYLKNIPRGFPKDHPDADLLRMKGFTAFHQLTDSEVMSKGFFDKSLSAFEALKPLNDYLDETVFG